jgi:polar amino acid transport system ATP-binding protein
VTSGPWIEITEVSKQYGRTEPLRIGRLVVGRGDRITLTGVDAASAEAFVHLVTGAAVPDEGEVRIAGRSTRDIVTDTAWLASLDRFGLVSERAVLLEALPVAANLALPITLAIDPMAPEVAARVTALSDEVGLARARLAAPASSLSREERARVHLARALAVGPDVLLLERPTSGLDPPASDALGRVLRSLATARHLSWVALSDDAAFARAAGGARFRWDPSSGAVVEERGFWRRLRST